jgi:hypothetical protein
MDSVRCFHSLPATFRHCVKQIIYFSFSDTVAPVVVVAFVARHLKNVAVDNGETLVFSTIVFNSGAGYDNRTGIFTVPVSGLYQFNVRLCIFVNTRALIDIVSEDLNYHHQDAYG